MSSCISDYELHLRCAIPYLRTYRYPKFLTALLSLWSSALLQTPFFMCPGILLHRLRQSLFVRPGSFAAMRFQSLRLPWLTTRNSPSVLNSERWNPDKILTLIFCFLSKYLVLFFRPPSTDSRRRVHQIFFCQEQRVENNWDQPVTLVKYNLSVNIGHATL